MRPWGDPTGCVLFVFITHFCLWFLLLKAPDSSEDSAHGKKCCAGGSGPPLLHLSALGEAPAPTRRLIHPRSAAIAHTAPILSAAPSVWQASASGRAPATAPADVRATTSERFALPTRRLISVERSQFGESKSLFDFYSYSWLLLKC